MKRYLVFAVFDYSEKGGLDNVVFEIDDLPELKQLFKEDADSGTFIYYPSDIAHLEQEQHADQVHILDMTTGNKYRLKGYRELLCVTG